jgi:hypothetical protein
MALKGGGASCFNIIDQQHCHAHYHWLAASSPLALKGGHAILVAETVIRISRFSLSVQPEPAEQSTTTLKQAKRVPAAAFQRLTTCACLCHGHLSFEYVLASATTAARLSSPLQLRLWGSLSPCHLHIQLASTWQPSTTATTPFAATATCCCSCTSQGHPHHRSQRHQKHFSDTISTPTCSFIDNDGGEGAASIAATPLQQRCVSTAASQQQRRCTGTSL